VSAPILLPPRAITVDAAADRLHCKRRKVFELLKKGRLSRPRERPGRAALVTVASLDRYEAEAFADASPPAAREPERRRRVRLSPTLAAIRPKE
jgi:excisionase family DNA binding protein